MARIEDIERRLLNWARWRAGAGMGGLGYSGVDLTDDGGRDGYREAVVPTMNCEASETETAVQALVPELRAAVEMFYLRGGGHKDKARRLGLSAAGMYARIETAHARLQVWLADHHARRRAERERVERLQATAGPARGF